MDTDNTAVQNQADSTTGLASTAIVVLCMHRTGSSLVANLLRQLGVNMGTRLWGKPDPYHKRPNPEDLDFVQFNAQLLRHAGGQGNIAWREPPSRAEILKLGESVTIQESIRQLIERKANGLWGWKDPRTSLTCWLYHQYLQNPRYVVVVRKHEDIIKSLKKRDPPRQDNGYWMGVIRRYESERKAFLAETKAPYCVIQYEHLVNRKKWQGAVKKLAQFVGVEPDLGRCRQLIVFR